MACTLPFLYRITIAKHLYRDTDEGVEISCKCCHDTGYYTITKEGKFSFCQFCSDIEVVLNGRYKIVKRVGEGNFSSVYFAQDTLSNIFEPVALKIYHSPHSIIAQEEISCLKRLRKVDRDNRFGTMRLFDCFCLATKSSEHFVLVIDALNPIDLFEKSTSPNTVDINKQIDSFCSREISMLILDVSLNLYCFHERINCIHGDVKPENILYCKTSQKFKLVDYGSQVSFEALEAYYESFDIQSFLYRAPELHVGVEFDQAIDIWAMGAIIYEACAKRPLVTSLDKLTLLTGITEVVGPLPDHFANGKYFTLDLPLVSAFEEQDVGFWKKWRMSNLMQLLGIKDRRFLDLLSGMLDPDPRTRITVCEVLRHSFLSSLLPFPPIEVSSVNCPNGKSIAQIDAIVTVIEQSVQSTIVETPAIEQAETADDQTKSATFPDEESDGPRQEDAIDVTAKSPTKSISRSDIENRVPLNEDGTDVDSQLQELAQQLTPVKPKRLKATTIVDNRKPPSNPVRRRAKANFV